MTIGTVDSDHPDVAELASLKDFLQRQEHAALVEVLIEQAPRHNAVLQRLRRWRDAEQPGHLARAFRDRLQQLMVDAREVTWRDAGFFADQLQIWLDSVEAELGPNDPDAALVLIESFMEAGDHFVEHADHDGEIAPVAESACLAWLRIAAHGTAPSADGSPDPVATWIDRILTLVDGDEYGHRRVLLDAADSLLGRDGGAQLRARAEARRISGPLRGSTP